MGLGFKSVIKQMSYQNKIKEFYAQKRNDRAKGLIKTKSIIKNWKMLGGEYKGKTYEEISKINLNYLIEFAKENKPECTEMLLAYLYLYHDIVLEKKYTTINVIKN